MNDNNMDNNMNNQEKNTTHSNNDTNNQKVENKKAGKKILAVLVGLAIAGGAYGAYYGLYASKHEDTENAYVAGIQNVVTSQVAGKVVSISVQDSNMVKKGQVAIAIDNTDYELNLERAANDLARTVRSFKSMQIGQNQSSENVSLKQSDLRKAVADYNKDKSAYQAGVLSKEQFDNTTHMMNQAKIAYNNALLSLQNSKLQVVAKSIYEHPDVAKAITQYKSAYIDLQRTKIIVPVDGVVAKKSVYIGQNVSPNQPLFTVVDVHNEWVDANFKESQLKNIKIGQAVEMHSDVNGKTYHGVISGLGGGSGSALSLLPAQNATGNWIKIVQRVPVRIEIDKQSIKENGFLPVGTSMRVDVDLTSDLKSVAPITQTNEVNYNAQELQSQIDNIIKNNVGQK